MPHSVCVLAVYGYDYDIIQNFVFLLLRANSCGPSLVSWALPRAQAIEFHSRASNQKGGALKENVFQLLFLFL